MISDQWGCPATLRGIFEMMVRVWVSPSGQWAVDGQSSVVRHRSYRHQVVGIENIQAFEKEAQSP